MSFRGVTVLSFLPLLFVPLVVACEIFGALFPSHFLSDSCAGPGRNFPPSEEIFFSVPWIHLGLKGVVSLQCWG